MNIHPAAWIAWATCAGIVAFSTTNPFYLALVIAIAWFVYAACHVPGPTARSFRVFLIAGLAAMAIRTALVFFGTVDANNVAFARARRACGSPTILVVFGTFNAVTDPFGVVRMAPRRFHEPALAAALALSIAPRTIASAQRVREAQTLRGLRTTGLRSLPALAVPDPRDRDGGRGDARREHGRARPRPRHAQPLPAAAVVPALDRRHRRRLTAAGVFCAAAFAGVGGLHPSTFPLLWPEVSAGLLAAAGLLAVPGLLPTARSARERCPRCASTTSRSPTRKARARAGRRRPRRSPRARSSLALGPTGAGKSTFLRSANGLVPQFTGGTFSGPRARGRTRHDGASAARARRRRGVRAAGRVGLVRARSRRGRARLRDGEPAASRPRTCGGAWRRCSTCSTSSRCASGASARSPAASSSAWRSRPRSRPGPRILVLDEPTSQLDPQGAEDVIAALQRLVHDHGITVLVAEHRLERVAGSVDVALGFDRGSVRDGRPGRGDPAARRSARRSRGSDAWSAGIRCP